MKNTKWLRLIILFTVIYSLIIIIAGLENIKFAIELVPARWWITSLTFVLSSHFLLSVRWLYYINYLHYNLTYFQCSKIYTAGLSLMAAPARSGEFLRSLWLHKRHNIPIVNGILITFTERISDLSSAILLIIGCSIGFKYSIYLLIFCLLCLYLYKILAGNNILKSASSKIYKKLCKYIPIRNTSISKTLSGPEFSNNLQKLNSLLRPIPFLTSTLLVTFSWIVESSLLYLTFKSLNVDITLQQSTLIRTSMGIGGAISLLPGGLITSESTSIALSIAYGSGKVEAIAATIFIRVYTLIIPSIIGLMAIYSQKDINLLSSLKPINK